MNYNQTHQFQQMNQQFPKFQGQNPTTFQFQATQPTKDQPPKKPKGIAELKDAAGNPLHSLDAITDGPGDGLGAEFLRLCVRYDEKQRVLVNIPKSKIDRKKIHNFVIQLCNLLHEPYEPSFILLLEPDNIVFDSNTLEPDDRLRIIPRSKLAEIMRKEEELRKAQMFFKLLSGNKFVPNLLKQEPLPGGQVPMGGPPAGVAQMGQGRMAGQGYPQQMQPQKPPQPSYQQFAGQFATPPGGQNQAGI